MWKQAFRLYGLYTFVREGFNFGSILGAFWFVFRSLGPPYYKIGENVKTSVSPLRFVHFCRRRVQFWLHFGCILVRFSVSWATLLQDRRKCENKRFATTVCTLLYEKNKETYRKIQKHIEKYRKIKKNT